MEKVSVIVNKREMCFYKNENGNYTLPTLSKKTKINKCIHWDIFVNVSGDEISIITDSYYVDGKHKISDPTIVVGKNKGRANETTNLQQGLFTAYSLWLKKIDQKYTENCNCGREGGDDTKDETKVETKVETKEKYIRPMLAHKYSKYGKKYLSEPFAVSPKLDGIRSVGSLENGEIVLRTRNGKELIFLDNVKKHLKKLLSRKEFSSLVVDGELYSHNLSFNEISGIARSRKNKSDLDDKMEFWIFDIVVSDLSYEKRVDILRRMKKVYSSPKKDENVLCFVDYELKNHSELLECHNSYVKRGFEGLMAREMTSKYEIGVRSNYLLKYKEFMDDEYKIVDTTTGVGGEEGAIVFVCETGNGKIFSVRPRGTISRRREMYGVGDTFVGKYLTVRFQELDTTTQVPRFPVGIEVRDYE
jgi:DNA ligase-1